MYYFWMKLNNDNAEIDTVNALFTFYQIVLLYMLAQVCSGDAAKWHTNGGI